MITRCTDHGDYYLEGVLKKRFLGDRTSGSTRTSSIPTLSNSNNSRLSISTTDSLTSFSSYRPPDWSMEIDSSPFPPLRSTSLPRRQQDSPVTAPEASSSVLPMHQQPSTAGSSGLTRTKSQPQVKMNPMHTDSPDQGLRRSQSLAKVHARPRASFGHAITCEEVAPPQRQRTQVYVSNHHRQSSQSTPLQKAPETSRLRQESVNITEPSMAATARTRQSSDNTMTGRSVRSAGSSFDIDLYTQMQLQEDNDSLEEEMRRSFSNPPAVDGAMDFVSPQPRYKNAEASSSGEKLKTRSPYPIPELTFRQPNFSFSPKLDLPAPRPQLEGGRKVSYYTHPRPAPIPPAGLDIRSPAKTHGWVDATGRPLSPSKSRARQKAARAPLQSLSSRNLDDDEDVLLPYLTDEQANRLLDEEDNTISGYGIRSS